MHDIAIEHISHLYSRGVGSCIYKQNKELIVIHR